MNVEEVATEENQELVTLLLQLREVGQPLLVDEQVVEDEEHM